MLKPRDSDRPLVDLQEKAHEFACINNYLQKLKLVWQSANLLLYTFPL